MHRKGKEMAPQIHDYIGGFVDGETGASLMPEGFGDGFESAYAEELGTADAAIQVKDQEIARLNQELLIAKAKAYDKNVASAPDTTGAVVVDDPDQGGSDADDEEPQGLDELGKFFESED